MDFLDVGVATWFFGLLFLTFPLFTTAIAVQLSRVTVGDKLFYKDPEVLVVGSLCVWGGVWGMGGGGGNGFGRYWFRIM